MKALLRSIAANAPPVLLAAALATLAPSVARAQFSVSAGVDAFHWSEDTHPHQVDESGPVGAVDFGWTQRGSQPVRLVLHSRWYMGWVGYTGGYLFQDHGVVHATTRYRGATQEAQVRARLAPAAEGVAALGFDVWERQLGGGAQEDFNVLYARFGVGISPGRSGRWDLHAGVRTVMSVLEDAHLDELGFDQNPTIKPQGLPSPYAQAGYDFGGGWAVLGIIDGFRFGASDPVSVSVDGEAKGDVVQPGGSMRFVGFRLARRF